ncbi:hypothetical protein CLOP_g17164 [Closterium sp. NIES-67]|nr:hypothetical protein CLOP_g17164 [Closterium sp. NIES-67]
MTWRRGSQLQRESKAACTRQVRPAVLGGQVQLDAGRQVGSLGVWTNQPVANVARIYGAGTSSSRSIQGLQCSLPLSPQQPRSLCCWTARAWLPASLLFFMMVTRALRCHAARGPSGGGGSGGCSSSRQQEVGSKRWAARGGQQEVGSKTWAGRGGQQEVGRSRGGVGPCQLQRGQQCEGAWQG